MKRLRVLVEVVIVLACVTACKAKPQPAPTPISATASPSAEAVGSFPAASASGSSPRAAVGLPESAVRDFVAGWAAAQNERDFERYSRLYADRFMGTKRVGDYTQRFDRAGWLVDRKPMLDGGAQVTVSDVQIVSLPGAARVTFTQEFVARAFRDVGKKEIFLVPSTSGIVISREEMLTSRASSSRVSGESVLAYHRDGVVVQHGFDTRKLRAQPRLLGSDDANVLEIGLPVESEALSAETRAWLGREVTAYGAKGGACTGRIGRFEVRVRAVPHFGMRQTWAGQHNAPRAAPQVIADAVHRMAQNEEHFVVGVLDRSCDGRWASATVEPFTPAVEAQGALRSAGLAAFKKLPAYAALQRRFTKDSNGDSRAWESVDGALRIVEMRPPERPALLVVTARSSTGCDVFNGSLTASWHVGGTAQSPELTPAGIPLGEFLTVHGAIDEGGAHGLALLSGPDNFDDAVSVLRVTASERRHRVLLSTSFWDCGC